MKFKLSIKERMLLVSTDFLVQESTTIEQLLIRGLKTMVDIPPKEVEKIGLRTDPDGMTRWDEEKEVPLEIDLTQELFDLLKKSSELLEQMGKINQDNLDFRIRINNLTFLKP